MTGVLLIRGAKQLLTLHGPREPRRGAVLRDVGLITDGAVLIRDGIIEEVGPTRRVENLALARDAHEIDATGRVVIPGFVDSHTHLVHGAPWLADFDRRIAGAAVAPEAGLQSAAQAIRTVSARRLELRARAWIAAMARHGTTTLESKSGFGRDQTGELKILRVQNRLDRDPLDIVSTLMAGEGAQLLPKAARRKLASFAEIRADHPPAVPGFLDAARQLGLPLKIHAAGAADQAVRLAIECGAVTVDHLECAAPSSIAALAASPTAAVLVPGAAFHLARGVWPPARALIDAGAVVALATGFNPHTSPTFSMQMVLALACSQMRMTPAEAIAAATINGAHAIGRAARTGSLEPGKQADLLILNASDYRETAYYFGANLVHTTVKRGAVA